MLGRSLVLAYERMGMAVMVSIIWFFAAASAAASVAAAPWLIPLAVLLVAPIHTAIAYWGNLVVHREDANFGHVVRGYLKFWVRAVILGAVHILCTFVCYMDLRFAFATDSVAFKMMSGVWVYVSLFAGLVFMYAYTLMVEQDTTPLKALRRSAVLILDNMGFTIVMGLIAALLLALGVLPTVFMFMGSKAAGSFSIIGVAAYAGISAVYRNLATVRLLQRYDAARVSGRERLQQELEDERMAKIEPTRITWHGHSCFSVVMDNGTRVVTDPFDAKVGYALPDVEANVVTISHGHYDHGNAGLVKGSPEILDRPVDMVIGGVRFRTVESFHDDEEGEKRGRNHVFMIESDDFAVCHLGDLGHVLDERQIRAIGRVDVLLIPVGGTYTLDAAAAQEVVEALKPGAVIPMHYSTPALSFELAGVDEFLHGFKKIERVDGATWSARRADLPEPAGLEDTLVVVLDYK